jgi:hypothetical protein
VRGPIQTRRYGSLLRAIWGLGGGTTPGDEASDAAVGLSFDLEPDLTVRPELAYPAGEVLAIGQTSLAAGGAGLRSKVLLFNPLGSNMITVLEEVSGASALFLAQFPAVVTTGFTASNLSYARDTRLLSPWATPFNLAGAAGGLVFTRNNNALLAGEDVLDVFTAGVRYTVNYVLKPGTGVMLIAQADNIAVSQAVLRWRSRLAQPQELNS